MSPNFTTDNNQENERDNSRIDYKRVFARALRFWYVVVLSLSVALAVAFFKNRYTPRVYPVSASIIIKETEETSGAGELLYKNALVEPFRNYLNELYIIRSLPLIESVISDLGFNISYYQEGSILTTEIYGDLPFEVRAINESNVTSFRRNLTFLNERQYKIEAVNGDGRVSESKTFNVNDTVLYNGISFCLIVKRPKEITTKKPILLNYTHPALLAGSYAGSLSAIWAEKGAGVVNLSVTGLNPQKQIDFLNGLIRRYQQYDLEQKNENASRTIAFITNQLAEISDSLRTVENKLERFKGKNIVTDLGSEANRLYEKLESVEAQKTEMIVRKNYFEYLTNYINQDKDLDQVISPAAIGLNSDPVLGPLISEMIKLQLDIKRIVGMNNADNPIVVDRKKRIQELKNSIVETVRNQQNTDLIRSEQINKQIKSIEAQLGYLPSAERQFVAINRSYALLENLYVFLLQKRAEASISKASSTSDVVLVNQPIAGSPISPKPMNNYVMAVALGLGLPFVLFLLLEYFNIRVQSKEDIEKLTTIPFIAGVGHKKSTDNKAVLTSPRSQIAESFRALRSNLSYFIQEKTNVVILVTSSISGEGKTFTTINLATVLAFSGKKTLIVGADMRRPKIFADFNLANDRGLSNFLAGMSVFSEIVQRTEVENLDVVTGGPVPPNPSELIMGNLMESFIEEARKHYDYIIIDSPPLAIVSDAFVLAQHSNHLLFVVRQNYTPKNMIKAVDEFYRSGRIKKISLMLNDIYKSGIGYGYGDGYAYGYGYGYGSRKNGYGYYSEK